MTFVLVHGAYHGAWCWELLVPELAQLGHVSVTVDLPSDDVRCGVNDYADAVDAALLDARVDGELVVVGHSLGGLTAPAVAARHRASKLVMLAALVPEPGVSLIDQRRRHAGMLPVARSDGLVDNGDGTTSVPAWAARARFYHDCDETVAERAIARLRRQANTPIFDPWPVATFPDVAVTSIVCADDRAVRPEWSRWAARELLGVEPVEIPGGHSPFLTRPRELAALLATVAA